MKKSQAVREFGSQAELARRLGIHRASVAGWSKLGREHVPLLRQLQIQHLTGGRLKARRVIKRTPRASPD